MPKSNEQSHPHRRSSNPCRIREVVTPDVYRKKQSLTYIGRGLTPPVYREESIPHVYEEITVKLDLKRRDN